MKFSFKMAHQLNLYKLDLELLKQSLKFANIEYQPTERKRRSKIITIKKLDYRTNTKVITADSTLNTYICENFIVTHQ